MITVDTLTPIERSAYNEGFKNGKKEAEAELTRTKRALWLAREKRAHERANMLRYMWHVLVSVKKSNDKKLVKIVRRDYDVWCVVARKCRTYADKFKGENENIQRKQSSSFLDTL